MREKKCPWLQGRGKREGKRKRKSFSDSHSAYLPGFVGLPPTAGALAPSASLARALLPPRGCRGQPGPRPSASISIPTESSSHSLPSPQRPAQKSQASDVTNCTIQHKRTQTKLVPNVSPSRLLRAQRVPCSKPRPRTPEIGGASALHACRGDSPGVRGPRHPRHVAAPTLPPKRAGPFPKRKKSSGSDSSTSASAPPPSTDPPPFCTPVCPPGWSSRPAGSPQPESPLQPGPHGVPRSAPQRPGSRARSRVPSALAGVPPARVLLLSRAGTIPHARAQTPSQAELLPVSRSGPPSRESRGPRNPPHSPAHQLPPPLPRRLARGHPGGPAGRGMPQTPLGAGSGGGSSAPAAGLGRLRRFLRSRPLRRPGGPGGAWPGQVRGGRTALPAYVKRYAMPPPGQPRGAHNAPSTPLRTPESPTDQLDPIPGSREMYAFQPFKHLEQVRTASQSASGTATGGKKPQNGALTSWPPQGPHSPNPSEVRRGQWRPHLHSLGAGPRPWFCHGPCSL